MFRVDTDGLATMRRQLLDMEDELSDCARLLQQAMADAPDSPTMDRIQRDVVSKRRKCNTLSDEMQRLARALQAVISLVEENEREIIRMVESDDADVSRSSGNYRY